MSRVLANKVWKISLISAKTSYLVAFIHCITGPRNKINKCLQGLIIFKFTFRQLHTTKHTTQIAISREALLHWWFLPLVRLWRHKAMPCWACDLGSNHAIREILSNMAPLHTNFLHYLFINEILLKRRKTTNHLSVQIIILCISLHKV